MTPADQVVTDTVSPMDVYWLGAMWILLIKQVVASAPVDDAIRVVHPTRRWREVAVRPVRIPPGEFLTSRRRASLNPIAGTPCIRHLTSGPGSPEVAR